MIRAIYLFYVFKFAPRTIDKQKGFWFWHVNLLNKARANTGDAFYLWRFKSVCIREPFAIPDRSCFSSSKYHPFCVNKED